MLGVNVFSVFNIFPMESEREPAPSLAPRSLSILVNLLHTAQTNAQKLLRTLVPLQYATPHGSGRVSASPPVSRARVSLAPVSVSPSLGGVVPTKSTSGRTERDPIVLAAVDESSLSYGHIDVRVNLSEEEELKKVGVLDHHKNGLDCKIPIALANRKEEGEDVLITLVNGSLLRQSFVDKNFAAIVNAANDTLVPSGGIDGLILDEVGKIPGREGKIDTAAQALYKRDMLALGGTLQTGCFAAKNEGTGYFPAGSAGIMPAYGGLLSLAGYVIQAVGPVYSGLQVQPQLGAVYTNCLTVAIQKKIHTVAFCPISTAIFAYPINTATPVAISSVINFLRKNQDTSLREVRFVTYSGNPWEYKGYRAWLEAFASAGILEKLDTFGHSSLPEGEYLRQLARNDFEILRKSSARTEGGTPFLVYKLRWAH
jgi:O-acetyl-ADP-ribose deacetylase (regulator of RNase III)